MRFLLCHLFILSASLLIAAPVAFSTERIIRLATLDWQPYVAKHLDNYGFTSEIVSTAFKQAGYRVQISFMPWIRVLAEVERGTYDAMYPAYFSQERATTFALSQSIARGPLVFCRRVDRPIEFKSLADLSMYKIGVVRGYVNTPAFDAADYLNKEPVNTDKQNLLKLLAGRIDLAVIDQFAARQIMANHFPQDMRKIVFLEPPLAINPLHVGFSRAIAGYSRLLDEFNQALAHMRETGVIDAIIKSHGLHQAE